MGDGNRSSEVKMIYDVCVPLAGVPHLPPPPVEKR